MSRPEPTPSSSAQEANQGELRGDERDGIVPTTANTKGEADERAVLERTVEADRADKHNGVEIQAYGAMIVCMLILISTGERPNRAMYQMVWCYLIGLASLKELEAFITKRR